MLLESFKYLALPPLVNALLITAGLLLIKHRRGLGNGLIAVGLATLLILATPLASYWLRASLEPYSPPTPSALSQADAIVILGGGRDYTAPEFGWGDAPSNITWRRLAYGAWLARRTGLPMLVSGGSPHDEATSEAELMAKGLEESFGLTPRWVETHSRTTAENARFSARQLHLADIQTIALVSQAWHLPRAIPEFERTGLVVIPAPTEFASHPPSGVMAWVPRAYYLRYSSQALHEWLGRAVYALRARFADEAHWGPRLDRLQRKP